MLVGRQVQYSVGGKSNATGVVLDKLDMIQTSTDPQLADSNGKFTITGYLIESDDDGNVYAVQYWRIKRVLGRPKSM
jgi:hypothetical protein